MPDTLTRLRTLLALDEQVNRRAAGVPLSRACAVHEANRDLLFGRRPGGEHRRRATRPLGLYNRLGDVAVSAAKLDDARGWFDKAVAVA
jgi:hypothetical protein